MLRLNQLGYRVSINSGIEIAQRLPGAPFGKMLAPMVVSINSGIEIASEGFPIPARLHRITLHSFPLIQELRLPQSAKGSFIFIFSPFFWGVSINSGIEIASEAVQLNPIAYIVKYPGFPLIQELRLPQSIRWRNRGAPLEKLADVSINSGIEIAQSHSEPGELLLHQAFPLIQRIEIAQRPVPPGKIPVIRPEFPLIQELRLPQSWNWLLAWQANRSARGFH